MLRGRKAELASLIESVQAARPVVLVGPAGIGKTSLATASLAAEGPFLVAGALATQRWSPLLLYRRLLGANVSDDPLRVAADVLRKAPGALLLDDLQWADDLALQVTGHLVGHLPLVATVRAGDPDASRSIDCLELSGFERVDVEPLGALASAAALDATAPDLSSARREEVLNLAAGNPLLLVELARSAEATPSLVSALHSRLGQLPAPVREAMERLSVLGRPAVPELLGPGATGLVAAGLAVASDGRVQVRHDLLAEVVVEDLGPRADELRAALAVDVPADEGAFLLAAAGRKGAARELALQVVPGATHAARAELLSLVVRCAPEGDLDVEHRTTAVRALSWSGQPERALVLAMPEGTEDLPPLERGTLRAAAAEAAWHSRRHDQFPILIEQALADLRGTGTAMEVEALAGSTMVDTRIKLDGRPALERARAAVELADAIGAKRGFARSRLGSVLLTSGHPEWVRTYQDALEIARQEGDHRSVIIANEGLVLGQWLAGAVDDAAESSEAFFLAGPPPGHHHDWLANAAYAAIVALVAATDRQTLIERWQPLLGEHGSFRNREYAEAAVALALADLGRHDEAARVLDGADRPTPEPQIASVAGWALAETAFLAGRTDEAARQVARVAQLGIAGYPPVVVTRLIGAYLDSDQGRVPSGPGPVCSVPGWDAAPLDWEGIIATAEDRPDEAVALHDAAAVAWAGHDRRCAVRSAWAAGDAARLAGMPDAIDRLRTVESDAVRDQVGDVVARARRSLRLLGVARGSGRAGGVQGLTARQQQVLERVGAGLTTGDIAAEFHVTRSTVDSIVRSAVRRLDAPNRRAAAAMVRADPTSAEPDPSR